jgi:uncharacterized membrane protein YphA (DoxX/SURF4 family)
MNTFTPMDPLAVWIPAAWLAVLFAHAGLSKLFDRYLFVQHLGAYRLPDPLLTPLSWALPVLELAVALALLSPWRALGAAAAAAVLLAYAGGMAWHLALGHRLDCGCGGEPLRVSPALVLRNLLLVALAGVAALPVQGRALQALDVGVLVPAVLIGAVLWSALHQLLRSHRPRHAPHSHSSHP